MPLSATADPLAAALGEAIAGRRQRLFDLLTRGSRLPGTRPNLELAEAFALACRSAGAQADAVAVAMARLSPDEARGGTALEFLPVCGVLAIGARAAADATAREGLVGEIHARADDLRFRVRDAAVEALARVGAAAGDALVHDVRAWMDGYFHAAAVLRALATDAWLTVLRDADAVVARLDEAFTLARDAPRAAARWPGHKALVEAVGRAPAPIAARFGMPVFDLLERWAATSDPALQEALAALLQSKKLAGRFAREVERVRAAVLAHRPAPRNPDHDVGPTRDRSKNRRRNRR
jgi:hypothetical protein